LHLESELDVGCIGVSAGSAVEKKHIRPESSLPEAAGQYMISAAGMFMVPRNDGYGSGCFPGGGRDGRLRRPLPEKITFFPLFYLTQPEAAFRRGPRDAFHLRSKY